MYLKVALLLAGTVFLYGQAPSTESPSAPSAAQDAQMLAHPVSLDELTEEKATQLEEAAKRQLDRAAARVARVRTLIDAGVEPRHSLEAPTAELALAQADYDLTLSRTKLTHEWVAMALIEEQSVEAPTEIATSSQAGIPPVMERFDGRGSFTPADLYGVKNAFEMQFHKTLPVSADGETAVHRAMGFDHSNRVDVALPPDTSEGLWLRHYLEAGAIPYYAFRSMVPGKATAAHIHIGPPSNRIGPRRHS